MNTTDSKDAVTREQIEQWAQIAGLRGMLHTEANIERLADFAIFARQDFAAALATNPQADGATVPPEVMAALDRMCTPLDASVLSGATASADAHSMQVIHDYVLATARSDAPTDELREDLQEAREILENMVRSIELDGNYSTEATCTFLRQALMCLPTELAATHAPAMAETVQVAGKPTERGIYAWIAEGSAALVHVHTRPTDHSPGGVLNGSILRNCTFYEGCAIDQWTGGKWYGPLTSKIDRAAASGGELES
jgi:hypothetical protein